MIPSPVEALPHDDPGDPVRYCGRVARRRSIATAPGVSAGGRGVARPRGAAPWTSAGVAATGHREVPGSVIVERNHLEWRLHPDSGARLPQARRNQQWIVLCAEGYTSSLAADALNSLGVAATDVVGGFAAWRAAGLPIVAARRPPISWSADLVNRRSSHVEDKPRTSSRCGSHGQLRTVSIDRRTSARTSENPGTSHSGAWPDSARARHGTRRRRTSMPHSVWCRSTISRVPSSRWLMANERSTSGVITPPAFLSRCASPMSSPSAPNRSSRESMHETTASRSFGRSGRAPGKWPCSADWRGRGDRWPTRMQSCRGTPRGRFAFKLI